MSNKFNAIALDQLLSDAMESTEDISSDLITNDSSDQLIVDDPVSPQINKMVNQKTGLTVDYSRVYAQLQKLIENGNVALQVLGAIDPDVSGTEVASSTASLMNAIKNCVAEFTKIHMQHIKFQQVLQLEQIKHEHKMQQLELRREIQKTKNNSNLMDITPSSNLSSDNNKNGNTLVPWNSDKIGDFMDFLKKQQGNNL